MKVLFVATVVKNHIMEFHIPYLKMLKEMGFETFVAAKNDYETPADCVIPYCDNYYDIPFERNPFSKGNIKAYKMLKELIDKEHFDVVHCHTPVGGVLGRLAARRSRKNGTKVFYTAHGFQFFDGGPKKDWLLYYPVEKFMSKFTDVLFTINHQDYAIAQKWFGKGNAGNSEAKQCILLPGIGIDISRFKNCVVNKAAKRAEIGVPADCFLLISVGELNDNKNHVTVIRALKELNNDNIHYIIAGRGEKQEYLQSLIKELNLQNNIHLLGYRGDIPELCKASDAFAFMSKREGLPIALLEAMACGLPVICSDIRGNDELCTASGNEFTCGATDVNSVAQYLEKLINNNIISKKMSERNIAASEQYDISKPLEMTRGVYNAIKSK